MSWIDEAKKEAEKLKIVQEQKEIEYQNHQKAEQLKQQERHTQFEKILISSEIFSVLCKAEAQGLLIVKVSEGYIEDGPGNLFGYTKSEDWDPISGGRSWTYAYCGSWDVTEPSSNKTYHFKLGFRNIYGTKKIQDGWFKSHIEDDREKIIGYLPTISAKELESEIKTWLVSIFS